MAGNENEIGAKYNVKGYPWINFYRNGKEILISAQSYVLNFKNNVSIVRNGMSAMENDPYGS